MTAKELLEKIIKLRKAIDYRKAKVASLVAEAERTTSQLTGMPHNPSSDMSPRTSAIDKKIDVEREIAELEADRRKLIDKIDLLEDNDLSRLLTLRYVQEAAWDDIAKEMGFCERHIYRLHRVAVEKFDNRLKDVI